MSRTAIWSLLVLALVWRLALAWLTPVPSEDGVSYLWMAERFAAGDLRAPLSEVFPPLLPLLVAAPLWLLRELGIAVSTFATAQTVLAVLGAATVWPVARLCAAWSHVPHATAWLGATWLGAALLVAPGLAARYCGEVYTEPAFGLCIACAALGAARDRPLAVGLWSGLAFWLRSEAALLPLAYAATAPRGRRLPALVSVAACASAVLALAFWRAAAGHGFALLPKLDFNLPKAAMSTGGWAAGLLELPAAYFEAFLVVGAAAVPGAYLARHQPAARTLLLTLAGAAFVIVAFAVRRRFLVAWLPLLLPFATLALGALGPAVAGRRGVLGAVLGLSFALGIAQGLRTTDTNRLAERDVGQLLATRLRLGDEVVTDLTRVRYFAGLRPLPPRHATRDELLAACRDPRARFLVLGTNRQHTAAVRAAHPEFQPLALPADLAKSAGARGLVVLQR